MLSPDVISRESTGRRPDHFDTFDFAAGPDDDRKARHSQQQSDHETAPPTTTASITVCTHRIVYSLCEHVTYPLRGRRRWYPWQRIHVRTDDEFLVTVVDDSRNE